MKSFDLGKAVKKWRQQDKSFVEIAEILQKTPDECIEAFNKYLGLKVKKSSSSSSIENLVMKKKKIHLYGETGVGKSFSIKQIAEELELQLFISYPTTEEELVKDFGEGPFIEGKNIFVIEGDAFYWKRYGLVKRYIEAGKTPLVIITNGKDTPTKNITKLLTQVKVFPPTRTEVADWIKLLGDETCNISEIYDKDWRKVIRNYALNKKVGDSLKREQKIEARQLAYLLVKGDATLKDCKNCSHPIAFVLTWLGWNTPSFYTGESLKFNMELISWIDANKHNFSQSYLYNSLLEFLPTTKKGNFIFPPFKKNKEPDLVEEKDYEIKKYKKQKQSTKSEVNKPYKSYKDELGDMLLI